MNEKLTSMKEDMTLEEQEAFIGGIEMAIDYGLDIPMEDFILYQELTRTAGGR